MNLLPWARTTNGKIGPVDLPKNENGWVCLKEYWFSKWIPADFMFVVMTSFSNRFVYYDVITSVIISQMKHAKLNTTLQCILIYHCMYSYNSLAETTRDHTWMGWFLLNINYKQVFCLVPTCTKLHEVKNSNQKTIKFILIPMYHKFNNQYCHS